MKNGPDLWDRILDAAVTVFGPDAVIAGGCVRDYRLGIEPKDIDVFVNVADAATLHEGAKALASLGFDVRPLEEAINEYEQAGLSELAGVLDGSFKVSEAPDPDDFFSCAEYVQVQFIACPLPNATSYASELIERFDLGITQAVYLGQGTIMETYSAFMDRMNRTMTLLRWDTEERVKRTRKRFDRIADRLPGEWTFVDPRPIPA